MTDHSPSLLPTFHNQPSDTGHAAMGGLSLPAVSIPTFTVTKPAQSALSGAPMRRSTLWRAAAGRWMNCSFDPAGSEAIRESVSSAAADEDDDAEIASRSR
jgi:hypothetical protein